MAKGAWADWTDEAQEQGMQGEEAEMLRLAKIMSTGSCPSPSATERAEPIAADISGPQQDQYRETKKQEKERKDKSLSDQEHSQRQNPCQSNCDEDRSTAAVLNAPNAMSGADRAVSLDPMSLLCSTHNLCVNEADTMQSLRPRHAGTQTTGYPPTRSVHIQTEAVTWRVSNWLLNLEVRSFIEAVLHPTSHLRWGRLSAWQRDLQQRCAGYVFPCPFWHAILYNLDLGLDVEAEAFSRLLLTGAVSLELLDTWQQRLRPLTHKLWFPMRIWHDLIHKVNLRTDEAKVRKSLSNLLTRQYHRK